MNVISEIVEKIRTAIYAREVREAIASGMETINDVAQSVRDDADAGKFTQELVHAGTWKTNVTYIANPLRVNLVEYEGNTYIALKAHYSSGTITPKNTTYWALFAQKGEAVLEDTGWVSIGVGNTAVSQVGPYGENTFPQVRRIGKFVRMRGCVTPLDNYAGSKSLTLTSAFPESYRPSKTETSIQQGSASHRFFLVVAPDGRILIQNYANGTEPNQSIPANACLHCDMGWFVD